MKYLIFCLENDIILPSLIKLISKNYNIELTLLKKLDFIKSNNCFIFKNQTIINKILNLKQDFDDIDQVLYFETDPELIPYFNIVKVNRKSIINSLNLNKNYIIPSYFNNPDYDHYYLIEFNMIDYIKFIYENDTFNENIDKLNDINSLVSNFDINQFGSQYIYCHILCISRDYDNPTFDENTMIEDFIKNIKNTLNIDNDDFYKYTKNVSKVCIFTDNKVNIFLDTDEGYKLIKEFKNSDNYDAHSEIKLNKKYLDKIKIDYLMIWDIFEKYRNNHSEIILSDDLEWYDIERYNDDEEGANTYFVIEGDSDYIQFINYD